MADVQISVTEADVQIAVIDQENTQLALAAPDDNQVNIAVPGVQGAPGTVNAAADGTAAAPGISFASDTNTGLFRPTADTIGITTGGVERLRIESSGRLLFGTTSSTDAQRIQSSTTDGANLGLTRFSANANAPFLSIKKSRGALNVNTPVVSGDQLGVIEFAGANGTGYTSAARIVAEVDGNPGAADMPGRLIFQTTLDGTTTSQEWMRITNAGRVGIGTTAPGNTLEVIGNLSNGLEGKGTINITSNTTTNNGFDASPSIGFSAPYSTGGPRILYGAVAAGKLNANSGNSAGYLSFYTSPASSTGVLERVRVDNTGRVGIGTTSPGSAIDCQVSGASAQINLAGYGSSIFNGFTSRTALGTQASPAAVTTDTLLGFFAGGGYTGASLTGSRGGMNVFASENWSTTANGTYITLNTTANGAGSTTERMRITSAGSVITATNSVASTPADTLTGTWFTGGTATTTKPHFLIEPTGTTSTAWSTSGTGLGVNSASGFAGRLLDLQVNGSSKVFAASSGSVTLTNTGGTGTAVTFLRFVNASGGVATIYAGGGAGGDIGFTTNNVTRFFIGAGATTSLEIPSGLSIAWVNPGVEAFSQLFQDSTSPQAIGQRNGTNAQTYRCYGTYTDASNYVRASLSSTSTAVTLAAETAGTGADNIPLNLTGAGTGTIKINSVAEVTASSTVAGLPASPVVGMLSRVTNATAPTVGSIVTGGGTAAALVWYNGTNWTVIGV